jgi:hypothetical protein
MFLTVAVIDEDIRGATSRWIISWACAASRASATDTTMEAALNIYF